MKISLASLVYAPDNNPFMALYFDFRSSVDLMVKAVCMDK